jgi:hypothetical protein
LSEPGKPVGWISTVIISSVDTPTSDQPASPGSGERCPRPQPAR